MSFADIFKKSFIEGFSSTDINIYTATVSMLITCGLALYIFVVYRVLTRKTFYSKSFNISLAGVALITSAIILTIQSSIVVSLGMVGALSIVRFRTAVKDPLDLVFLFWAIGVGIICGVGLAEIAVILSLLLTFGILILNYLPLSKAPLMLIVNVSDVCAEKDILNIVSQYTKHYTIKSRNVTKTSLDLIVELRVKDGNLLVQEIVKMDAINNITLMSHDGEVTF